MSWILRAAEDLDRARRYYRGALAFYLAGLIAACAAGPAAMLSMFAAGAAIGASLALGGAGSILARLGDRHRRAAEGIAAAAGSRSRSWN